MMKTPVLIALAAGISLLSGCVASIPPVEVTRFHRNLPLPSGPTRLIAMPGDPVASDDLEHRLYAAAVQGELTRLGHDEARSDSDATFYYAVRVERFEREITRAPSSSVSIGAGSFGRSLGISLGTSFPIGKRTSNIRVLTRLSVRLMSRGTPGETLWEGRAQTEAPAIAPAAQPGLAADKLARALFKDFPGTSGATINVP